jgi:hypothetical protein
MLSQANAMAFVASAVCLQGLKIDAASDHGLRGRSSTGHSPDFSVNLPFLQIRRPTRSRRGFVPRLSPWF